MGWLELILLCLAGMITLSIYVFGGTFNALLFFLSILGILWIKNNWNTFLLSIPFGRLILDKKAQEAAILTSRPKITFADVAGIDEVVEDVKEIVDFLKNPQKYLKLGGKIPRGVLLIGEPGVGKTLLAKAIAGEAGITFDEVSGSSFVRMFVGVGADNVRKLFQKSGPRIIFIDELDALGKRSTGSAPTGGDMEYDQTINEFLVQMDGFRGNEGKIVIGATNRPDRLDEAMTRPGRFDRRIIVNKPDITGRIAIFEVHTKNKPLAEDVEINHLARITSGFSGADIANMVNEAAISAAKKGQEAIKKHDFEMARERILLGIERKSPIITDDDKKIIAYHESGHAFIALLIGETPPTKISTIPRGFTLGSTFMEPPKDDNNNPTKKSLLDQIQVLLGGRAAEVIALNTESAGGKGDFDRASEIASLMVCELGMSEMGPLNYTKLSSTAKGPGLSEETKRKIDAEIRNIVNSAFEEAKRRLSENRRVLDTIALELFNKETMLKERIEELFRES